MILVLVVANSVNVLLRQVILGSPRFIVSQNVCSDVMLSTRMSYVAQKNVFNDRYFVLALANCDFPFSNLSLVMR
jgi:hypothetical protein